MKNPTPITIIDTLSHAIRGVLPDHFRRARRFGPEQVLLTLLTHLFDHKAHGYEGTLTRTARLFGQHLGWSTPPSPSNFTRARAKLDNDLLLQVYGHMSQRFAGFRRAPGALLGGKRPVAIDACYINMPATAELKVRFGQRITEQGPCYNSQAQLVVLWDIWAQIPITWAWLPCNWNERDAAKDLLACLDRNDILIGDRAYPSRELLQMLDRRGIPYVFRLSAQGGVVWREAKRALKQARWRGRDHVQQMRTKTWGECPTFPARIIKTRKPGRRQRKRGYSERLLITNLPKDGTFTTKAIERLYRMRWHIEVAFRELKATYHLERFSGRTEHAIDQEIIAFMILWLLKGQVLQVALWRYWHDSTADRDRYHNMQFKRPCVLEVAIESMRATFGIVHRDQLERHMDKWFQWLSGKTFRIRNCRSRPRWRLSPLHGWHNNWRNFWGFMAA